MNEPPASEKFALEPARKRLSSVPPAAVVLSTVKVPAFKLNKPEPSVPLEPLSFNAPFTVTGPVKVFAPERVQFPPALVWFSATFAPSAPSLMAPVMAFAPLPPSRVMVVVPLLAAAVIEPLRTSRGLTALLAQLAKL